MEYIQDSGHLDHGTGDGTQGMPWCWKTCHMFYKPVDQAQSSLECTHVISGLAEKHNANHKQHRHEAILHPEKFVNYYSVKCMW